MVCGHTISCGAVSHFVVFGKKNVIEHLFVGLLGVRVGRGFEGIWVEMEGDWGGFGMICGNTRCWLGAWNAKFWSVYRGGCLGPGAKNQAFQVLVYPPTHSNKYRFFTLCLCLEPSIYKGFSDFKKSACIIPRYVFSNHCSKQPHNRLWKG